MNVYWCLYTLAWLSCVAYFYHRARAYQVPGRVVVDVALVCLALGLAVSHGLFALVKPLQAAPLGRFLLTAEGWSWGYISFGGVVGALCGLAIIARVHRLAAVFLADLAAPSIFIASILGRLGCFLHGCCYGAPTAGWWSVHFPAPSPNGVAPSMAGHHPVQLYEAAVSFVALVFTAPLLASARFRPGRMMTSAVCLLLYLSIRFVVEFFRIGGTSQRLWLGLSGTQVTALLGIGLCILLTYRATREHQRNLKREAESR